MKKLLKKLERWFDFNIAYYTYNGNKLDGYYDYIERKYGTLTPEISFRDRIKELNPEAILWDDLDNAIVGITEEGCVVYSVELMQSELAKLNIWTPEEAFEWIEYNILSAKVGDYTPVHVWGI
jgi:hypothetical protein